MRHICNEAACPCINNNEEENNMKIHFGLRLDGQKSRHFRNAQGDATLGPVGFLALLEGQLGLTFKPTSQAERIVQYRQCLKNADNGRRFYSVSFGTDEVGTAERLLGWRDTWYESGWDGCFAEEVQGRLRDMADVEVEARKKVESFELAPSMGERLADILGKMDFRRPAIESIFLNEPLSSYSMAWQKVLAKLGCLEVELNASASKDSFLYRLQSSLMASQNGQQHEKTEWVNDGSVTIVRAETPFTATRWIAEQVRGNPDSLILCESGGELLDGSFKAADIPRLGFSENSAYRPALQLLPLGVKLLWGPLNFNALIEFLTHPYCPISGLARFDLAELLSGTPGIGGEKWKAALDALKEKFHGENANDQYQHTLDQIAFWIERIRHEPREGAPVLDVVSMAQELAAFFRWKIDRSEYGNIAEISALNAGMAQCMALASNLGSLGDKRIAQVQLEKQISQATAQGHANPYLYPEAGCSLSATDPREIVDPCDQVIWWQRRPPRIPSSYPWFQEEMTHLRKSGVDLPQMDDLLKWQSQSWLRPVLAAKNRLVLVLPSEGDEHHPLWLMIKSLTKDIPLESIERLLENGKEGMQAVDCKLLPEPRRWWHIEPGLALANPPEKYSHSSLNLFLNDPARWVMQYPARLGSSSLLSVADGPRLYGLLAHRAAEWLLNMPGALQYKNREIEGWFEANFEKLVEQEGAVLNMPGRRAEKERVRNTIFRAVTELVRHLREANTVKVETEKWLEGSFEGGRLQGSADIVVETKATTAIIDMKWGASNHVKKLRSNTALQLAIYAELTRQAKGVWSKAGYFILSKQKLHMADNDVFKNAVVEPSEEGLPHLWQHFLKSWRMRLDKLANGDIEVTSGLDEKEIGGHPEDGLPFEKLDDRYNEYLFLTGWGRS